MGRRLKMIGERGRRRRKRRNGRLKGQMGRESKEPRG
jgi:hypothetical protein